MQKILKLLSSSPIRLVLTVILAFLFNHLIPVVAKQFFLSVSLSLKEILMFMIPLIIFSSVYGAFSKIRGHAFLFVGLLLTCIVLSNFFGVTLAGIFSYFLVFGGDVAVQEPIKVMGLEPLWTFSIPKLVSNNIVLILSLILACIKKPIISQNLGKFSKVVTKIVDVFLKKIFIPLLPVFIFGFLVKLLTDDIIGDVLAVNPKAFIFMVLTLWAYLLVILYLAVIFYKKPAITILRNVVSPVLTSFTAMSSAAALPFSIKAAENNTGNKNIADVVMPATVNIHMIGDSICIPILAMILLLAFGIPMPSISSYLVFAATFTITKFSGAAVPGGSILIMIPVLESCLGFTTEMVALITICYMLIDPITTSGNVLGNNIFVMHFNKLYGFITKKK